MCVCVYTVNLYSRLALEYIIRLPPTHTPPPPPPPSRVGSSVRFGLVGRSQRLAWPWLLSRRPRVGVDFCGLRLHKSHSSLSSSSIFEFCCYVRICRVRYRDIFSLQLRSGRRGFHLITKFNRAITSATLSHNREASEGQRLDSVGILLA